MIFIVESRLMLSLFCFSWFLHIHVAAWFVPCASSRSVTHISSSLFPRQLWVRTMKSREENGYLYGKRLLQGMGWSEGKGLGKHEDGIKEFIKVKKKMNTKGIGFNGVDDRWIEHQEAFDDLLATLNGGKPPEDQQQLSSIEERSRRLGGRVHYSKFLRGKDLSQKKQKDIDAIIIKRKRDKVADDANLEETGEEARAQEFPNTHTSNMSYQEYFARRMKDLKAAQGKEVEEPGSPEREGVTQDFSAKTRSKSKSRKLQPEDTSEPEVTKEPSNDESTAEAEVARRKRQKKKRAAAADECREEALGEGDVVSVTKQATEEGSCDGKHRKLRLSDPDSVWVEKEAPVDGSHCDKRKKGKQFVEGDVTSTEARKARKVVQRAVGNDIGTLRSACADFSRENLDTARQSEFRHRKERKVLETIDGVCGSDKVASWEEGKKGAVGNDRVIADDGAIDNGGAICTDETIGNAAVIGSGGEIGNSIDENRKKRKKAKRKRAETEGENEGNEAAEKEGDMPMPKSRKTKNKAKMDGRLLDEETKVTAVDENNKSEFGKTTELPRNDGAKAVERTPLKLLKHKKKASPIVKKGKVPRMNADKAGHLAQWIVESPEASRAADRLAMGNKALLASRFRNLLLREHRGSNWALIPGYGSPAWMEKCTALLALTLREQEEAKAGEGTTG
uniref:Putative myosin i n=1 Tax=Ixodes scapularis TaxID=6945 RepID=A0A4D5S232_IXOSC